MASVSHRGTAAGATPDTSVQAALDALDARIDALEAGGGASAGVYSVTNYGAVGDGVTDDFAAITTTVAAMTAGGELFFPPGDYLVSKAVILTGLSNFRITGKGATIVFPSADTALTDGEVGYGGLAANARSAFYLTACSDVTIDSLDFTGDSANTLITENGGKAVSCGGTVLRLRMRDCSQSYGGGLINMQASDEDAVISDCFSYASRTSSRVGNNGVFQNCTFELPTTASYDRVGNDGTSHAIYFFSSSGNRVSVVDCTFKNIRIDGVKMSGTNLALQGLTVRGCKFYNCGYNSDGTSSSGVCILFGADDSNPHRAMAAKDNQFFDCQCFVQGLGSANVQITGNQGFRTTTPTTASAYLIDVSRYGAATEPVEDVIIDRNTFSSSLTSNTVYADYGIKVNNVGVGITGRYSTVRVTNNQMGHGISSNISVLGCIAPVIEGNTGKATITVGGSRMPRIVRNEVIDFASSNSVIRISACSWPVIKENMGGGVLSSILYHGTAETSNNAGSGTPQMFPLSGYYGQCAPTASYPEVVVAYGSDWTTGDIFNLNGTSYVYNTHFTSFATLVTLIDNLANYVCTDYGADWSATTQHLKIRYATTQTTANFFYVETTTANKNAGVVLGNNSGAFGNLCYARGEDPDKIVIWSPCCRIGEIPIITPENAAAATALQLGQPYPVWVDAYQDAGCCVQLQFPSGALTGTELFQWRF